MPKPVYTIYSYINLTQAQKTVVKKICRKELKILGELLSPGDVDALLYASLNNLAVVEVNSTLLDTHQIFLDLEADPETLPQLDPNRLDVFKQLLIHLPTLNKYPKARRRLFNIVNSLQNINDFDELNISTLN